MNKNNEKYNISEIEFKQVFKQYRVYNAFDALFSITGVFLLFIGAFYNFGFFDPYNFSHIVNYSPFNLNSYLGFLNNSETYYNYSNYVLFAELSIQIFDGNVWLLLGPLIGILTIAGLIGIFISPSTFIYNYYRKRKNKTRNNIYGIFTSFVPSLILVGLYLIVLLPFPYYLSWFNLPYYGGREITISFVDNNLMYTILIGAISFILIFISGILGHLFRNKVISGIQNIDNIKTLNKVEGYDNSFKVESLSVNQSTINDFNQDDAIEKIENIGEDEDKVLIKYNNIFILILILTFILPVIGGIISIFISILVINKIKRIENKKSETISISGLKSKYKYLLIGTSIYYGLALFILIIVLIIIFL